MPWPIPDSEARDLVDLRRQFDLERGLAAALWDAPAEDRPRLYARIYDRLFAEFPHLARAEPVSRSREVALQASALGPFLDLGATVLEVGAGDGALAAHLAPTVGRYVAVEASREAISDLRPQPNLVVLTSGEIDLPLEESSIDLAYSCHFVEHLHPEDARRHAAEMRRVLSPGGHYVVVTPNRLWGPHDVSRFFSDRPAGLHLREYGFGDLARLLRDAGFVRVFALRGIGRPPEASSVLPLACVEAVLGALPFRARRAILTRLLGARSAPPFRPLEQVVLAARA
jgi:SAM-dependent methyltransferase